jgi:hypothetical protein
LRLVIVRGDDEPPGIHQRLYVLVDGMIDIVEVSGFPQRKSQLIDGDLLLQETLRSLLRPLALLLQFDVAQGEGDVSGNFSEQVSLLLVGDETSRNGDGRQAVYLFPIL